MKAVLVGRAISYQSHRRGFEFLCRPFFAQQKILALGVIYILRWCLLLSQHCAYHGNQVIRTRLENGLDAGRIRGKIRVIPRYSAAEPGAESARIAVPRIPRRAELKFRAFRADSACHRIPRLGALDATRVRITWLVYAYVPFFLPVLFCVCVCCLFGCVALLL